MLFKPDTNRNFEYIDSFGEKLFGPLYSVVGYISENRLSYIIIWIAIVSVVTLFGTYLSEHTLMEREGMFYNNKKVDKFFYILLSILSALIPFKIVDVLFNWQGEASIIFRGVLILVYVVSVIGFLKLYKPLFKLKS